MTQLLYVAPAARGQGTGLSEFDAADYLDCVLEQSFWAKTVREALLNDNVNVAFLNGEYTRGPLDLEGFGHLSHHLILQGQSKHQVVLKLLADVDAPHTIAIRGSQNIIIRNLNFTGEGVNGVVLLFRNACQNILVEQCNWFDLPNLEYGATQASDPGTSQITYKNCTFKRVGSNIHQHMMYHADGCHTVNVINCSFEDCSGQYVRFRNNVEHGVLSGCQFLSTGTYPKEGPESREFIHIYVRNDINPGDEYFGTNYVIAGNTFNYANDPGSGERYAISFEHDGYDPPGRNHLMTAAQGDILEHGTAQERKNLLNENCGIDGDKVKVYGNRYLGVEKRVAFESHAETEEESKGWEGDVTIDDIINEDGITTPSRWLEAVMGMMMR